MAQGQSSPSASPDSEPAVPQPEAPKSDRKPPRTWRRFFWGLGAGAGILVLIGGAGLVGTEYWTSRPSFCGSCHIMDPYYESWSHDLHGAKIGVLCVDCHYAPGERFTLMAKFKGLSQVTSYFSGRYGAGRPRAHVADDSCLRSGCHGDNAFATKMLPIGEPRMEKRLIGQEEIEVQRAPTVNFFHYKHLETDDKLAQVTRERDELSGRLRTAQPSETYERILKVATSVAPVADREAEFKKLVNDLQLSPDVGGDVRKLIDLTHRRTRLAQLDNLNCSACHSFDPSLNHHLKVDRQACYTCHFANEAFNHGTGECLRCHQPPTRSILVHDRTSAAAAQPVLMDHQDIVKRGVDCASCHMDVVRGDTRVNARDCTHCHDQSRFLEDFESRTTETVEKYHEVHVQGQRARCTDCHRAIQHGLFESEIVMGGGGFLRPVLNDCQHCHPAHHSEQVALLMGTGGAGLAHTQPNPMMGSRLNCRACHTETAEGMKGDALLRATEQGCTACHGSDYAKLFDQWKHELDGLLKECSAKLDQVQKRAAERGQGSLPPAEAEALEVARRNVKLVAAASGMHNRNYSVQLLEVARRNLEQVEAALEK